jgi:hypothetical protein
VSEPEDCQEPRTAAQRWEEAQEPFHWTRNRHMKCFPYGVEFEPVTLEPWPMPVWRSVASLADTFGEVDQRPPEGLLWTLGRNGGRVGKPWRLRGPFVVTYDSDGPNLLVARGGVIERHEPQVLLATSVRITPLDSDGQPTGPSRVMQGVADVLVTLRPAVEDAAVAVGHLAHATITATAQLKRFTYSRVLNAFYIADRVLTWTRDNRPVWIHRSWLRPGPAMGLTRRQRRSQRRIHRRGTR